MCQGYRYKFALLCVLMFTFPDSKEEGKLSILSGSKQSPSLLDFNFFSNEIMIYYRRSECSKFATFKFSKELLAILLL
jgi:hypothetical protein